MTHFKVERTTGGREEFREARGRAHALLSRWILSLLGASLCFLIVSEPVLGQGCPMCKTAVAVQQASAIQALNLGIVVLLLPPLGILACILVFTFRRDE